jgi:hypothetical protein
LPPTPKKIVKDISNIHAKVEAKAYLAPLLQKKSLKISLIFMQIEREAFLQAG